MDPKLKAAISQTTLLSEATRARLLRIGDKLKPEEIAKVIASIEAAEAKKTEILSNLEKEKIEISQKHLDKIKHISRTASKDAYKAAEKSEGDKEEEELDSILSELDKL